MLGDEDGAEGQCWVMRMGAMLGDEDGTDGQCSVMKLVPMGNAWW
mgnify:CR=1 FL=1